MQAKMFQTLLAKLLVELSWDIFPAFIVFQRSFFRWALPLLPPFLDWA